MVAPSGSAPLLLALSQPCPRDGRELGGGVHAEVAGGGHGEEAVAGRGLRGRGGDRSACAGAAGRR